MRNNSSKTITSALEELGAELGISEADFGGKLTIEGNDPVVASRHHLGESTSVLLALFGMYCSWLQEFGLFPANEVHGAGLPESMMAAPGLNARLSTSAASGVVRVQGGTAVQRRPQRCVKVGLVRVQE